MDTTQHTYDLEDRLDLLLDLLVEFNRPLTHKQVWKLLNTDRLELRSVINILCHKDLKKYRVARICYIISIQTGFPSSGYYKTLLEHKIKEPPTNAAECRAIWLYQRYQCQKILRDKITRFEI